MGDRSWRGRCQEGRGTLEVEVHSVDRKLAVASGPVVPRVAGVLFIADETHIPKTNGVYRLYAYDQHTLEAGKRYVSK